MQGDNGGGPNTLRNAASRGGIRTPTCCTSSVSEPLNRSRCIDFPLRKYTKDISTRSAVVREDAFSFQSWMKLASHDGCIYSMDPPHVIKTLAGSWGSLSAVSTPIFASKYSLESSRRDLHNVFLCTVLQSQNFSQNSSTFFRDWIVEFPFFSQFLRRILHFFSEFMMNLFPDFAPNFRK